MGFAPTSKNKPTHVLQFFFVTNSVNSFFVTKTKEKNYWWFYFLNFSFNHKKEKQYLVIRSELFNWNQKANK